MPIALGGIWLFAFLRIMQSRSLIVSGDPQRITAAYLRRLDEEDAAREEESAREEAIAHE